MIPAAVAYADSSNNNNSGERGDSPDKSFKIRSFGTDKKGDPCLTVEGLAGSRVPDGPEKIFAYGFATGAGLYAVTLHTGSDTTGEEHGDLEWHTYKLELDADGCITSMTPEGDAEMATNRVTIAGTGAMSVSAVMTAEFVENSGHDGEGAGAAAAWTARVRAVVGAGDAGDRGLYQEGAAHEPNRHAVLGQDLSLPVAAPPISSFFSSFFLQPLASSPP